jgi:hypothetical protein
MRYPGFSHIVKNSEVLTIEKLEELATALNEIHNTASLLCISTETEKYGLILRHKAGELQTLIRESCREMRMALSEAETRTD